MKNLKRIEPPNFANFLRQPPPKPPWLNKSIVMKCNASTTRYNYPTESNNKDYVQSTIDPSQRMSTIDFSYVEKSTSINQRTTANTLDLIENTEWKLNRGETIATFACLSLAILLGLIFIIIFRKKLLRYLIVKPESEYLAESENYLYSLSIKNTSNNQSQKSSGDEETELTSTKLSSHKNLQPIKSNHQPQLASPTRYVSNGLRKHLEDGPPTIITANSEDLFKKRKKKKVPTATLR